MDSSLEEEQGDDKQQQKQNYVGKEGPKGKSCKGYLYYSSSPKSHNLNPRCIGDPHTLHQVPNHVVRQSKVEALKDGWILLDFYYAYAGYSAYRNLQYVSDNKQGSRTELPVCVGLELLVDRKVPNAAPARNGEGEDQKKYFAYGEKNQMHCPTVKFTRNANLVV